MMQKTISISAINYNIRIGRGPYRFKSRIEALIKSLALKNIDLIVLPEYLGFDITTKPSSIEGILSDVSSYYDRYQALFKGYATKFGIYILAGTMVEPIKRRYYNTAHLFTPQEQIIKYRKIHLHTMDIELGFKDGNEPVLTMIKGIPVGLEICYDLGFPELTRIYALSGALGILTPALAPGYGAYNWLRYCGHARAIETQGFLVLASGTLEGMPIKTYGKPAILTTTDYEKTGVVAENEKIATGKIDINKLLIIREKTAAPILKNIKPNITKTYLNKLIKKIIK